MDDWFCYNEHPCFCFIAEKILKVCRKIGDIDTAKAKIPTAAAEKLKIWRFVTGTFQIKIPVKTGNVVLPVEENTLAIMKWRLEGMSPSNRWYPVLQRYVKYISERVKGLGGNPNLILASPKGAPEEVLEPCREHARFIGKVVKINYDCFGDFQGFVLSDCCKEHEFKSNEPGLSELIIKAFRDRLKLVVIVGSANTIQRVLVVE